MTGPAAERCLGLDGCFGYLPRRTCSPAKPRGPGEPAGPGGPAAREVQKGPEVRGADFPGLPSTIGLSHDRHGLEFVAIRTFPVLLWTQPSTSSPAADPGARISQGGK